METDFKSENADKGRDLIRWVDRGILILLIASISYLAFVRLDFTKNQWTVNLCNYDYYCPLLKNPNMKQIINASDFYHIANISNVTRINITR